MILTATRTSPDTAVIETALRETRANRLLIDELSSRNLLSPEARALALAFVYPAHKWSLWISRLLISLGSALVLAGVVFFFAFNWRAIPPAYKLGSVQIAIACCLLGAWRYDLRSRLSGKVLLLCAAVLVGVFQAVFGQIYQTGADAYSLFLTWSLLILPWAALAEFAALWTVWFVVTDVALIFYWHQAAAPPREMQMMIFSYLVLLNSSILAGHEYLTRCINLPAERWFRVLLVISILIYAMIPAVSFVLDIDRGTFSVCIGAVLCVAVHIAFFCLFRSAVRDMWCIAATVLSACLIADIAICRTFFEGFNRATAFGCFVIGAITLGMFTFAVVWLRSIAEEVEDKQ